jgi:hypothetical protein
MYDYEMMEEVGEDLGKAMKGCSKNEIIITIGVLSTTLSILYYFF